LTDEEGLPPRVIIDANARPILTPVHEDLVGVIEASPEVLRAILALPELVEAARKMIEMGDYRVHNYLPGTLAVHEIEAILLPILARIDGAGGRDGEATTP
jgi:hypothetical protein